jgi:hypothetical protein
MKWNAIASAVFGVSVLAASHAHAAVVIYNFAGDVNSDPYTAHVSLDVSVGNAISGTGTITGAGLTGTQSLTLITLASPGVENDGGGLLGYRSNDGTDWFDADTAVPIDSNGLIFAIGPNPVGFGTSQQFDVYNIGGNNYDAGFFGKATAEVAPEFYSYNDPVNLVVSAVPEPATWTVMLLGFGLVGAAIRRTRAKQEDRVAGVGTAHDQNKSVISERRFWANLSPI